MAGWWTASDPAPALGRSPSGFAIGTFTDGFIHAGNLAYLAIFSIFPFFILGAALFSLVGEESERAATINAILFAMPPVVGNVIEPVARGVIEARSGWLLWLGALVALWTVGSLVESIRDVLRRAYGTQLTHAFWKYRLFSTGVIIGAVFLLMLSLIAQVIIGTAQQVIEAYFPQLADIVTDLRLARIVPALGLFGSLYLIFYYPDALQISHEALSQMAGRVVHHGLVDPGDDPDADRLAQLFSPMISPMAALPES